MKTGGIVVKRRSPEHGLTKIVRPSARVGLKRTVTKMMKINASVLGFQANHREIAKYVRDFNRTTPVLQHDQPNITAFANTTQDDDFVFREFSLRSQVESRKDNDDQDKPPLNVAAGASQSSVDSDLYSPMSEESLQEPSTFKYKRIQRLRYDKGLKLPRRDVDEDNEYLCSCDPAKNLCGEGCLNRDMFFECDPRTCPCGELCTNTVLQRARRGLVKKKLVVRDSSVVGKGLFAGQDFKDGEFIGEYLGIVVSLEKCAQLLRERSQRGIRDTYFVGLHDRKVIDAFDMGNKTRFFNHSCEPNCNSQKWLVAGEHRVAMVAIRDIAKGEELTFDYKFEQLPGSERIKCLCGTKSCRGWLTPERVETAADILAAFNKGVSRTLRNQLVHAHGLYISGENNSHFKSRWMLPLKYFRARESGVAGKLFLMEDGRWVSHDLGMAQAEEIRRSLKARWEDFGYTGAVGEYARLFRVKGCRPGSGRSFMVVGSPAFLRRNASAGRRLLIGKIMAIHEKRRVPVMGILQDYLVT